MSRNSDKKSKELLVESKSVMSSDDLLDEKFLRSITAYMKGYLNVSHQEEHQ